MRSPRIAAAIVILSLVACASPDAPTPEPGPERTPVKTPEVPGPSPISVPPTAKSSENTLVETPEYTGVIISEDGVSEFGYLFDSPVEFWEPSLDDVSRAEACIRQFLVSAHNDPSIDSYQQESLAFIVQNLETYRRQYVGIVVDGEKRIWCNSFFSDASFPNWERVPVDVDGGGRHYWQIEYRVPQDDCTGFYVHGES